MNQPDLTISEIRTKIPQILEQAPYIEALVLFGSRARGDHSECSDWDLAVLYDEEARKQYEKGGWDAFRLWGILSGVLNLSDDDLDLVDLRACSDITAHCVAQDGIVLYEQLAGRFETFRQTALKSLDELSLYRQKVRSKVHEALARWRA